MPRRTSPCSAEPAAEQDELSSQMRQIAQLVAVGAPLPVVMTAGLAAEEGRPRRPVQTADAAMAVWLKSATTTYIGCAAIDGDHRKLG